MFSALFLSLSKIFLNISSRLDVKGGNGGGGGGVCVYIGAAQARGPQGVSAAPAETTLLRYLDIFRS